MKADMVFYYSLSKCIWVYVYTTSRTADLKKSDLLLEFVAASFSVNMTTKGRKAPLSFEGNTQFGVFVVCRNPQTTWESQSHTLEVKTVPS